MIWVMLFLVFFFLFSKDFLFFNSFLVVDYLSMFMNSFLFLTFYLLAMFLFFFLGDKSFIIYYFLFFYLSFMCSLAFFCSNCYFFIMFLEFTIFPMSLLIFLFSKDFDKISSLMFMLIINMMGSFPFFYFVFFSSFFDFESLNVMMCNLKSVLLLICFFLILLTKLPIFLSHFWLSKMHVSASGPCSMVLASIMLKLGSFGLLKFMKYFFCEINFLFFLISSVCLSGSVILAFVMMRFFDLKYVIACSSVIHMSGLVPMILVGKTNGIASSMYMMVGHGLVSYILFFVISILYEGTYNRSVSMNKSLESFSKTLMMFCFVFLFLNLGVPPFMNFLSEVLYCISLVNIVKSSFFFLSLFMLTCIFFSMNLVTKLMFGKKTIMAFENSAPMLNLNLFTFLLCSILILLIF